MLKFLTGNDGKEQITGDSFFLNKNLKFLFLLFLILGWTVQETERILSKFRLVLLVHLLDKNKFQKRLFNFIFGS